MAGLLEDFVRADRERGLGTYGIHVHSDGRPPVEHRFRPDERVDLRSVAKTFTAVALGMAEAEGRLGLDDRLLDHLPELRGLAADGFEAVTLRQLTTMTSGTGHQWFAHQRIDAPDLLAEIVAARMEAAPGTRFRYTGSGPYAVGRVIARVSGADLREFLTPRLFRPLGLHDPAWHACPLGFPFGESGLHLTTGELARFARLLLDDGEWAGRRILPDGWVGRMTGESVGTGGIGHGPAYEHGYGLGVWLERDGAYRMDGAYGQYAIVDPRRRAAVTVTAHSERDGDLLTAVHDLVLARLD
ncbi:penicillin-binding protein [Actinoplanes lobatus]|uniref:CubicO group peptidase (Beta-lactamase class C family) n=1 Tax=Actinoplanes lobatus TaxID=113568 RepID=A0A7W7MHI5_9ACTN|nr:serine hydrolase domain-containing protein [Actinoplanes lobatus]MBB4750376.1 CubicO group peptidase (beta-lactamase class C family) [Actinoplanes lobatus]GGN71686.1 penicillin-binding protein [Actinoplanes lobatus]GIE41831.1 penicillin-binding protein [Actinoplanes lobatus]